MTLRSLASLTAVLLVGTGMSAYADEAHNALARDIFKELVEINTTESVGNVTQASEAMAKRLLAAGYPAADVRVLGSNERKKNLVVRLRGTGKHRPVLLIGHLDVVEAKREDWTTDPFQFVEKDGFYYGRGTQDMKNGDAIMVATLIRLKQEGFRPSRDVILALTADEEGGDSNGVDWLLQNQRELVDAEFVINHDENSITSENGKPLYFALVASEKVYADYLLTVTNPGGHSSRPGPDNAIYELAEGLGRLAKFDFPFELNNVSRSYYERMARTGSSQRSADMRAILASPPDPAALERLSHDPIDRSTTRTTCVATRLDAGHANNALPQRAQATVNCRVLPGHSPEEVRQTLIQVLSNPKIRVQAFSPIGEIVDVASDERGFAPPPLRPEVLKPLEKLVAEMWGGIPVLPTMTVGATDGVYTSRAGLPTYVIGGIALERDDNRAHGQDERLGIDSFYQGVEFFYRYLKAVTAK